MANKQLLQSAGDGTAVPSGYVGERAANSAKSCAVSSTSGTWTSTSETLSPGIWLVTARGYKAVQGTITNFSISITPDSASSPAAAEETGISTQYSGGAYTAPVTLAINSAGSFKIWTIQIGTSLGTSAAIVWWTAVRIA